MEKEQWMFVVIVNKLGILRQKWRNNVKNKYNIGDKVKTKIHYQNDKRKEVEAIVLGIELKK